MENTNPMMDVIPLNGQNQITGKRESKPLKCLHLISTFEKMPPWQHDADGQPALKLGLGNMGRWIQLFPLNVKYSLQIQKHSLLCLLAKELGMGSCGWGPV